MEIIIITDHAGAFIPGDMLPQYEIVRSGDPSAAVDSLPSPRNDEPRMVFLCVTAGELASLKDRLGPWQERRIEFRIVLFGTAEDVAGVPGDFYPFISESRHEPVSPADFRFIADKTFAQMKNEHNAGKLLGDCMLKLDDTRRDQEDLINIGKSLSSEKDPDQLLTLILFLSKKITGADAGSIYLVEDDEKGEKRLRFKYSHTFSRDIPLEEFVMAMNKKSIAGYVAVTGEVLNIADVYHLPSNAPYSFNSSFDEQNNYICKSMLVVPMRNHIDEIIGVIQLINSKEDPDNRESGGSEAFTVVLEKPGDFDRYVVSFNPKYDGLLEAIAGQAAIAIENNRMIKQIQNQFKEFVRASVTAIESRDPATSGHSFRVADVCKYLAYAVNRADEGYLKDFFFDENAIQELEFAALLHDFGKVYIDNSIFRKEKKLFPKDYENLLIRIDYLYRFVELKYSERRSLLIVEGKGMSAGLRELELEKERVLSRIRGIKEKVSQLNEPAVTDMDPEEAMNDIVKEIGALTCLDINDNAMNIITDGDRVNLTVRRGSLNPMERKEIETHVIHTYNFVSKIPWPPEYRKIPEIALRHHEALDGSGYPHGISGKESMSLQSRMVSIADIYDALTAHDRPYKKAVPLEKVLKILNEEAERGKLDRDLVDLFIREKIYEMV